MKNLKLVIRIIALVLIFNACDDNFLDRSPLDAVGETDFFKSPNDLKTYVNRFYTFAVYGDNGGDRDSDIRCGATPSDRLNGDVFLDEASSINFSDVRRINYFFDNYKRVEENWELDDYKQYLGEAHFFRARIYFSLLRDYGDIQWFGSTLGTESEDLTAPRDLRDYVADKIIADLDSAIMYLQEDRTDGVSRLNKWMALNLQSDVALFEGTWEKYHAGTPFGVAGGNPDKYLNKAASAALQVINSGLYSLYSTGDTENDYNNCFVMRDYSGNPEVMQWKSFDNNLGKGEVAFRRQVNYNNLRPYTNSITRNLADQFLCTDGLPVSVSPEFQGYTTLVEESTNRDPRFKATIATPDRILVEKEDGTTITWGEDVYWRLNSATEFNAPCGYVFIKGHDPREIYHIPQYEETPGIITRYAEVLLKYAEAKAELGTITQADLDMSINKLRNRVGLPHLILNNITVDPNWVFPDLSPIINEVRRERAVELGCEGGRFDDLLRWAAFDELVAGKRPKGMYADQLTTNPYHVDENGFLDPFFEQTPNGYGFHLDRDYLLPIAKTDLLLNPNIDQNPGWGD